ncbi:PspC domain-containing protein [Thermococcus peptonophilus]|uniref:PspC domain-containing protein n=1 Tax=Thermococcus peptonophilus TaxID=53952 RepID=UPI000A83ACC9
MDPTIVRLIFVVLFAVNPGVMTLAYLLAALVMPEESSEEEGTDLGKKLEDVIKEAGGRAWMQWFTRTARPE